MSPLRILSDSKLQTSQSDLICPVSLFRTMGARHLVVVDGELAAVGVITRADMNEHRLAHFWHEEVWIIILVLQKTKFLPSLFRDFSISFP